MTKLDAVFYSQTVAEICSTTSPLCILSALATQCTTDQTSDSTTQGMQKHLAKQQSSPRHLWLTPHNPGHATSKQDTLMHPFQPTHNMQQLNHKAEHKGHTINKL